MMMKKARVYQKGFTLVEILITLAIGMIILAGMSAVFVSQTRVASMMNGKTAALGDLFLASQIMQSELRSAKSTCWNAANSKLLYQPLDSTVPLVAACNVLDAMNGSFEVRTTGGAGNRICWDRPNDATNCQELLRDLMAPILTVTPTGNTTSEMTGLRHIVVNAAYSDADRNVRGLGISFKIWPRNPL